MQPQISSAQNQLAIFSKFRQELNCDKDKIVFYLENSCLSAKDSLNKIQTFAEDLYRDKEIIFVEHVSANHFQIQKKERNSWNLTRKDVYGDGRCGIVSAMVALKELELINDDEFNKYIDHRSRFNKLKDGFGERGTQNDRDELAEFLCKDITDPATKLTHQDKISTLLSDPRRENWLDSDTIKEVLASKASARANIKIFGQNTQFERDYDGEEETLLLKIKDTKFEVATVLLGLLVQKFQGPTTIKFAINHSNLFEGEDPQLKIKLGFPEGRKVEFSDIFPIAESREKMRCFYTDNSDNVSSFLQTFDQLNFNEATLTATSNGPEFVKLFKNVGLLIHQIDHIKKTQPDYRGIPDITQSKEKWDDLADRILESNSSAVAELKKDIRAIRARWRVGENEERLAGTVEKAKQATITQSKVSDKVQVPAGFDGDILSDLMKNFKRLENSGSIPDKEIFLSTCQLVSSQASSLKDKDEFLKSFANFFFDNLENFYAIGDMETANLAYGNFNRINDNLGKAGVKTLEEFLDEGFRKKHYQHQKTRTDGYFDVLLKDEPVVEEKLKQFSLELLNQSDEYIKDLHKKIEKHFKKEGTFFEKIKTLRDVFKGDVLETYAEFFSKIDSSLIPDSCKPSPDHAYFGWGQQIEVITTDNPKSFELKKDGKKITSIQYEGEVDNLEWFKSIQDEKLRALEITNFFRSANNNIIIYYENETTPEVLKLENRSHYKVNKKSGKVEKSREQDVEKYDSLKFKLRNLEKEDSSINHPGAIEPSTEVHSRSDRNFFEQLAGVVCCGDEGHQ